MEHLQDRLSKWQVMALSRELHHDEAGISKVCDLMIYAEDAQSAYNAASRYITVISEMTELIVTGLK